MDWIESEKFLFQFIHLKEDARQYFLDNILANFIFLDILFYFTQYIYQIFTHI